MIESKIIKTATCTLSRPATCKYEKLFYGICFCSAIPVYIEETARCPYRHPAEIIVSQEERE